MTSLELALERLVRLRGEFYRINGPEIYRAIGFEIDQEPVRNWPDSGIRQ